MKTSMKKITNIAAVTALAVSTFSSAAEAGDLGPGRHNIKHRDKPYSAKVHANGENVTISRRFKDCTAIPMPVQKEIAWGMMKLDFDMDKVKFVQRDDCGESVGGEAPGNPGGGETNGCGGCNGGGGQSEGNTGGVAGGPNGSSDASDYILQDSPAVTLQAKATGPIGPSFG